MEDRLQEYENFSLTDTVIIWICAFRMLAVVESPVSGGHFCGLFRDSIPTSEISYLGRCFSGLPSHSILL